MHDACMIVEEKVIIDLFKTFQYYQQFETAAIFLKLEYIRINHMCEQTFAFRCGLPEVNNALRPGTDWPKEDDLVYQILNCTHFDSRTIITSSRFTSFIWVILHACLFVLPRSGHEIILPCRIREISIRIEMLRIVGTQNKCGSTGVPDKS